MTPRLLTYKEAAEQFNVSVRMLKEGVNDGDLKAIVRGRGFVRLVPETVERWILDKEELVGLK